MNGAPTSWASRRAISVLPTPVGPIRMMFFGVTSVRSSAASCCLRQRLRMATATAFFAAFCPTMYLSSSATICRGVMDSATVYLQFGRQPVCNPWGGGDSVAENSGHVAERLVAPEAGGDGLDERTVERRILIDVVRRQRQQRDVLQVRR